MQNKETTEVRPLARVVARELSQEEVAKVAAGCNTGNGNSTDCTTGGAGGVTDRDQLK